MALPCFNRILEYYPHAKITLLTNKPVASKAAPLQAVLGENLFYHKVLTYPVGTRNPIKLARLLREIRLLKIDTVINITALRSPSADKRDKRFFALAGAKTFIGFDQKIEDFKIKIDPSTGEMEWEAKRLTKKLSKLGFMDVQADKYWNLRLTESEKYRAAEVLGTFHNHPAMLAINAGTKMPIKDWGPDNWLQLLELLQKKYEHYALVIVGVEEESQFAQRCLDIWKGAGLNLCGKTNPRVSAAVLAQAKLFIGHDSGPLHLAACVGVPSVGIFSCINKPRQWFPKGENNKMIFPDHPCDESKRDRFKNVENRMILQILPSTVAAAADQILRNNSAV